MSDRVVLSNALLYDGSGGDSHRGGLVVEDGLIVDVGTTYASSSFGVDLDGKAIAPGIIDMHTHSDVSVFSDVDCVSAIWQGVTTQIVGHCGFSAAPTNEASRLSLTTEEPVFGFPNPTSMNGNSWGWTDISGYLAAVAEAAPRTNVGSMVGHNTVRRLVIGPHDRRPTGDELSRMKRLVEEALEQGALGVTSGLSYPPGVYARDDELVTMAAAAGRSGRRYHTHMRYGGFTVRESLAEAIATGRSASTPVNVSHLYPGRHDQAGEADVLLEMIDDTEGDVTFDLTLFQRGGGAWSQSLPPWALEGGLSGLVARLDDRADRERLVSDVARMHAGRDWEDDLIVKVSGLESSSLVGRTTGELAREWGVEPPDATVTLLEKDAQFWIAPTIKRQSDLDTLLRDGRCVPVSDGMASHPTRHAHLGLMPKTFGTFPLLFGDYVRGRGILGLTEAVARVTSLPAERLGLRRRGRLAKGYYADLFVFDPAEVANAATDDNPAESPIGITDVMVNGVWAMRNGQLTAHRAGVPVT